ncbi:transcription initiation factor TFIID complex 145kD subunit [Coccidioides immitis RS]|uniref:Transcription initiation factor TFIID complex 145kD subunit n=1 Tax=Coccidioides immitis (strain RS) TaxID=246410 RepID=J3KIE4_COCIM|nr:transcription initiation factor TFIID complex 145kD subunit [Coccidioides immitis RS]EAS35735.3 transcription initiation factor TFIID complex 145kD subunit [Coccidioides immitis RS]TPX26045.1 hypothetical protein DIZ76_011504 [Coccidioides immitis]
MSQSTQASGVEPPEDDPFDTFMRQLNSPTNTRELEFMNRELDPGEKADDAVDYEDIDDDDDLPDEEPLHGQVTVDTETQEGVDNWDNFTKSLESELHEQPAVDELDDLFGDVPSSPVAEGVDKPVGLRMPQETPDESGVNSLVDEVDAIFSGVDRERSPTPMDMDPETLRQYQLQQALFAMSSYGPDNPPAPPENHEELLASLWPKFDRNSMPRFLELLPPKKSHYIGKTPLKRPKRVIPTKLKLELAQDQERSFRSTGKTARHASELESPSVVVITPPAKDEDTLSDIMDLDDDDLDEELPGGVTMQDLQFICADWDIKEVVSDEEEVEGAPRAAPNDEFSEDEDDWLFEVPPPAKKRKLDKDPADYLALSHIDLPLLDDPAETTAKLARKLILDMNDPRLLIDERTPEVSVQATKFGGARKLSEVFGSSTKRMMQRYNISNDEAYEMLKENHKNKVRSTLGNIVLEHSMPAVRLQWPYYKTRLARQEARSFHRPVLTFFPGLPVTFKKPTFIKRKHQKGKDAKTLYDSTKSLSLADNSTVLLVEYSEEHPMMMSNFGMGSRVINYYRKKNAEDALRPKGEVGETAVLLPEDKSPFSTFGHVDPGETTTAIATGMFLAPLFRQEPKGTDFLVVRNSTGVEGASYYLRNIENLYVAGQQFPSVDVPGPHSRKVTTAAKNRLKMICYRQIRKNRNHRVSVADITEHFPESTDMQNRQKMKEFLQFSKDHKEWEMRSGEPIPDEDVLRGYVKPEDVCLLESMQVGLQYLHDAGYDREEDEDDDGDKEGDSLEQQLAPWKATRNFLLASQGKAMLQLHGEGDPTGRGEGFSFIKTSMKGGFRAVGESVEDKLDAQRLKELGGHSYNVARQQKSYEDSIRRIWESQKKSLSSTIEHSDAESDIDVDEAEDLFGKSSRVDRRTPLTGRRDDDTTSQFSRLSTSSQTNKVMKITRQVKNAQGQIEEVQEIVKDPRVIKQYQKQRYEAELRELSAADMVPTGDPETDARRMKHIQDELQRLQRNKERRHAREKQKSLMTEHKEGSPDAANSPAPATAPKGATQRKCANCGQVGHIKTNKKLCPLLNGTMKPEEGGNATAFMMPAPAV